MLKKTILVMSYIDEDENNLLNKLCSNNIDNLKLIKYLI